MENKITEKYQEVNLIKDTVEIPKNINTLLDIRVALNREQWESVEAVKPIWPVSNLKKKKAHT